MFARPILCVDIGGSSTKAGVLDTDGDLKFVESVPTEPDVELYFGRVVELIRRVRKQDPRPVELGVSVAGFLDDARSKLIYNSNLSWLERFPLKDELERAFPGLRIEMEVDSNAATLAEYRLGSGAGSQRFLCVTCGTGLGVGMAVGGKALRFTHGCLGDIGHVIVQRDGPMCSCGGRGCAEVLISAPVLADRFSRLVGLNQAVPLRTVIDKGLQGDADAVRVLTEAGEWLGVAIASMANILFPDQIAIAGGLSAAGDLIVSSAERLFRQSAGTAVSARATIGKAKLGSQASLAGAASPFWD